MKIAIVGYGKMGREIERIARERGHEVTAIIDVDNMEALDTPGFLEADVAIEFTTPGTAVENYRKILSRGVTLLSGTTGWNSQTEEVRRMVSDYDGRFFWTSNYSLGVNIFFMLSRRLAQIMNRFPQYTPTITETHHIHKLDHPSGTAVSLARDVIEAVDRLDSWSEEDIDSRTVGITSIREGEVPGIHTVRWDSPMDQISLTHESKSRQGLALGAVVAAEWLVEQPAGYHDMKELMHALIGE